jgi:hypothetical protein
MPFVMGACGRCRRLLQHQAHQWELPGAGDRKVLERMMREGQVRCDRCGDALEGEWSRTYAELELDVRASSVAAAIKLSALPTSRSTIVGAGFFSDVVERNASANNYARAVELARRARKLYRELTFMFDTDADGRVIEGGSSNGSHTTGRSRRVRAESARSLPAGHGNDVHAGRRSRGRRPSASDRGRTDTEARAGALPDPRRAGRDARR